MFPRIIKVLAVFSTVIVVGSSPANAISLDEFLGQGVASSSIPGTSATSVTADPSAIGGQRALYALKNSTGSGLTRLETFADPDFVGDTDFSLGYTQGAHAGQGIVSWDGDANAAALNPSGLGVVDLTQDNGTALLLGIKFFDYPSSNTFDITIRLYDASNPSGLKYSDVTVKLNQAMNFLTPFPLTIPFTQVTTAGASTVPAPSGTFEVNTSFGPSGAVDLKKVGAIQLILNGLTNSNAPDITLDVFKTNGYCDIVPNSLGRVVDDCGFCLNTSQANNSKDSCGLCPSAPNFNKAKDPCGVCFGDGSTCKDCAGIPNGSATLDVCGVCAGKGTTCLDCSGVPFGTKGLDKCDVCGGPTTDVKACTPTTTNTCTTVVPSNEVITFQKRLIAKAQSMSARFRAEVKRSAINKCGVNARPSTIRVQTAVNLITARGKDIFLKGIEVCGDSCETVSYAEEVTGLTPQFAILEKETLRMAKGVQACYRKKRINNGNGVRGVATTVTDVRTGLRDLIADCRSRQVCPAGK